MTDPLWINADEGAPEYSAVELRRNQAMLLTHGVADGLGARAGFRPGGSDPITLSGQTISVHPRPVTVYPGESSTDGPYIGHLVADTHSLDPADGSNGRVDVVVTRVYDDDHDSSGRRELVTEYISGTPAADPDPPSIPPGALLSAVIEVPAGGSPSPSLEFVAPFTVASGGILPVRDADDSPTSGLYNGLARWRQDQSRLEVFDGSSWLVQGPRAGSDVNQSSVIGIEGKTDLGVEVEIDIGPLGIAIVTQTARLNADTDADTRTVDLWADWAGANTGGTSATGPVFNYRSRSVLSRQASGSTETYTFILHGLNPGLTSFVQAAQISGDTLDVLGNRLAVVTF